MLLEESVSLIKYQHLHPLQFLHQFIRFLYQFRQSTRCSYNYMWIFFKLLILHTIVHSSYYQGLPQIDTLPEDVHLLVDLHCKLQTWSNNYCEDAGWIFGEIVKDG